MLVDVLIVLFTISSFFRGREIGFIRQALSSIGFFAGLLLGSKLQPLTVRWTSTPFSQSMVTLVTTLGLALVFLVIGEYIGVYVKRRAMRRPINSVDNGFGGIIGIITLLATVWLGASILSSLPYPSVHESLSESRIISTLNRALPSAPSVIADISKLVNPNGFPDVFIGQEPRSQKDVPLPDLGPLRPAVLASRPSVVKLEGQGCGGIVDGSGFIIGPGLIATNAHVIAGIKKPYVVDSNGTHSATPILFNPNLDFAVLRVPNLAGKPLSLDTSTATSGTAAATLGYPGGGGFTAKSAVILDRFDARGRDIYGRGVTLREVYEVRSDIIPGNSGGPIVNAAGKVIGVVFAQSTTYEQTGYALTAAQVSSSVAKASAQKQAVGTGSCTTE
jgi:S1-C subfamily serine protease